MKLFELSVALKYLSPRWRQLSVSIISLISILVISLVVWLIVVFFSVTHGLEKNWVQKLIALTAPVRITPTQHYYDSYYYQIDSISANSDYNFKTLGEKRDSFLTDPYDPVSDEEIPHFWPAPKLDAERQLLDPVKIAFETIEKFPNVTAHEYEMTFGSMRLRLLRDTPPNILQGKADLAEQNQSFLTQNIYIGSFDSANKSIVKAMIPLSVDDANNLLNTLTLSSDNLQHETPDSVLRLQGSEAANKLRSFFEVAAITGLQTQAQGWRIPRNLLPETCSFDVCVTQLNDSPVRVYIPLEKENLDNLYQKLSTLANQVSKAKLEVSADNLSVIIDGKPVNTYNRTPLILDGKSSFSATPVMDSISNAKRAQDVFFDVTIPLQGYKLQGSVPYQGLDVAKATFQTTFNNDDSYTPSWFYKVKQSDGMTIPSLPVASESGDSILLPKSFREAGVLVGDRGYIAYTSPTASSMQEQRIPISVAGFYDPGIIPLGGKFVLTTPEVTSLIRSIQNQDDTTLNNGINLHFDDLSRADAIKSQLLKAFDEAGIGELWKVETYKEYEFTKDILQQLDSEKNLFSLLAVVIIIVACSNIISMLIILVNDKKQEIGILRSMGASSFSITCIFGTCGVVMGLIGSALGIVLAFVTLQNLQSLIGMLSKIQGHEMFNPAFYGETLPTDLSPEALAFVVIMTAVISTLAGIVPAIKACLLRPSEILRAE